MTRTNNEAGFSYIDLMIAIVIMMVGILGLTGALTVNLMRSYETDSQLLAKQHALSTIESIFSAREIHALGSVDGWNSIGNVGNNPGDDGQARGIYLTGFNPIRAEEGGDGVFGTADDACASGVACPSPGHSPNTSAELKGFLRKIEITDIANQPGKRRVDVTIRYAVNRAYRDEKMSTMITNFQ
jgi:type II secretory pathway pseudopilin PulG